MDNLNTHRPAALYEAFELKEAKRIRDRFGFVYTPKQSGWLNMEEIELNILMGQCLNRRIDNIQTMQKEVKAWQTYRNNKEATVNWQFTNDNARIKLKRLLSDNIALHGNLRLNVRGKFFFKRKSRHKRDISKIVNAITMP